MENSDVALHARIAALEVLVTVALSRVEGDIAGFGRRLSKQLTALKPPAEVPEHLHDVFRTNVRDLTQAISVTASAMRQHPD